MPETSPLEIAVMLFIVIGILVVVFRSGRANPENTGQLAKSINTVKTEVRDIESRIGHVEQSIAKMATKDDVRRLEQSIDSNARAAEQLGATIEREMKGHREMADQTRAGVKRLEDFFLAKGVNGQ